MHDVKGMAFLKQISLEHSRRAVIIMQPKFSRRHYSRITLNKQVFHCGNIIYAYTQYIKILYMKDGMLIVRLLTALESCVKGMSATETTFCLDVMISLCLQYGYKSAGKKRVYPYP